MKAALWTMFASLALLWTGAAALLAKVVEGAAQALAAGGAISAGAAVASMPAPAWLAPFFDAAHWSAVQDATGRLLQGSIDTLPAIGTAVTWLEPSVWLFWGLGAILLLGVTLLAHAMLGRFGRHAGPDQPREA